jgi:trehalose-6-phosphate synthase
MFEQLKRNDVNHWCESFLSALETSSSLPNLGPEKPQLLKVG